jgi:tocopherol cyclase
VNPLLRAYRATGADQPGGDPLLAHGVAMEGYFWRFTDVARARSVIALIGVNQGPRGPWATLGLAAWPGSHLAIAAREGAYADPVRVHAASGDAFDGDDRRVLVDLGPDARLDVRLHDLVRWPRRRWGGSSIFHSVPALNQYWHPWLLGGRATGTVSMDGETWSLDGAQVYAEKNWGKEGFPEAWWWGQAQGFEEPAACVAFAGGLVHAGPLRTTVTALVVRLPDGHVLRLGDPVVSPVETHVTDTTWTLRGRGFGWRVRVDAYAPLADAHVLPVPLPSRHRNTAGALEHLGGALSIRVERRGRLVWQGDTTLAGLEHGGLDRAEDELRRRAVASGATGAPPAKQSDR